MKTWECKIYEIAENAFAYVSPGTFAMNNPGYVAGTDAAIVIDTMSGVKETQFFAQGCAERCSVPVRYLVYTHNHSDHILGAHVYENAVIIGQKDIRPLLEKARIPKQEYSPVDLTGARVTLPDIYFDKRMTIDLGGRTAEIYGMGQCHSLTDTFVYIPEIKTVYCGDLLFTYELPDGSMGRIDAWIKALDFILSLDAEIFVPGHGPIADRDEVLKSKTLLELIYSHACKCQDAGMHQIEAIRSLQLGEYEEYPEPARRVTLIDSIYRSRVEPYREKAYWNINTEMDRIRHERGDFDKHFVVPFDEE